MSGSRLPSAPPIMMHNFRWNDLLNQIAIGHVVPIIGQGLVSIVDQGKERLLYSLLAQRLAEQLAIDRTALPEDYTISDVVIAYPHFREFPDELYSMLYQLWTDVGVAVPETLLQLAQVGGFPLYLSTTFDTFLERALGQVLSLPEKAIDSVGYALNQRDDLRAEGLLAERPTVYHLFGRVSPSPEYAATDADLLEYVSFMQ
jgi:hypothetical protein